ncbi:hypothetical protein [Nocardioides bruguierae]|uniref:hypothetical protein n=1 Tax=Nocardioides bruguierae TaxID=2945102 RepID=UPI002020541F|nr:hypothetical protein [Nocardioides bruguierae]MCL8026344.1 hypothetical protein [Nocardioides bruguierae]
MTGPDGFTESFDAEQVDTLVRLGLIQHDYDGHVLQDGAGNGVGHLHHFYREADRGHETGALLTPSERTAIEKAGSLWNDLCQIVGDGPSRAADLRELVAHIHAIQRAVMAQAGARTCPDHFRLLGETLSDRPGQGGVR